MEAQKIMKRVLAGLGIVFVFGYGVFALSGFVRGPRIEIHSPEVIMSEGRYFAYATTSAQIEVSGRAIHAGMLFLNDAEIPQNLAGNFSESLLLAPGYNIMSLEARDRYGRISKNTIEITLRTPKEATSTGTTTTTGTSSINF